MCSGGGFQFLDVLYTSRNTDLKFETFWTGIALATGRSVPTRRSDHWSGPCRLGSHSIPTQWAWNLRRMLPKGRDEYWMLYICYQIQSHCMENPALIIWFLQVSRLDCFVTARWMQYAPRCSRNSEGCRWLSWLLVVYLWIPQNILLLSYKITRQMCGGWKPDLSKLHIYGNFATIKCAFGNDEFRPWSQPTPFRFKWEMIQTLWLLKNIFDRGYANIYANCNNFNAGVGWTSWKGTACDGSEGWESVDDNGEGEHMGWQGMYACKADTNDAGDLKWNALAKTDRAMEWMRRLLA
jgi:hypothetical protein